MTLLMFFLIYILKYNYLNILKIELNKKYYKIKFVWLENFCQLNFLNCLVRGSGGKKLILDHERTHSHMESPYIPMPLCFFVRSFTFFLLSQQRD